MSECRVIEWTRAKRHPAPLDRVEAGQSDYLEGDVSADLDCAGAGVTIVDAVPSIRAEDDDGNLTFGARTITGLVFRVPYTVNAATPNKTYSIAVTVTTSDNRTLAFWYSLPVAATVHPQA